jgi:predicted negative regulator of RcsB-dependent stress response
MASSASKSATEDRFQTFWRKTYQFYLNRRTQFLGLVAAVVVIGLAVWGWNAFQSYREGQAWLDYEAVLAKISKESPEQAKEQAVNDLKELIQRRSGSKAADQARLKLAALAVDREDFEEAIKQYLAFRESLERDDPLRPAVADALGHCFESAGKLEESAQWYTTVSLNERLADLGLWNLGRVQELAGKKDEARATYQKLLDKHPNSVYSSPVYDRLVELKG